MPTGGVERADYEVGPVTEPRLDLRVHVGGVVLIVEVDLQSGVEREHGGLCGDPGGFADHFGAYVRSRPVGIAMWR